MSDQIETVTEHCIHKDCKYRSRSTLIESCDYMLVTRRPRGCKISECNKYEIGRKKMISTLGGFRYDYEDDWW